MLVNGNRLTMLDDAAAHVREKVIKSVSVVFESDVDLLGDQNV